MAVRTVSILGGNWSATTAWTGGVVPIAGDTVNFTATSGNLTVDIITATLAGIDFTNYINTITINNAIVLNTNLNLGTGGYTQAGSNGLSITANTTISGTTTWTRGFLISANAAVTLTLSNNLNITDLSLNGNAASLSFILGGNTVSISNNISFIGGGTYTLNIPHNLQITNLLIGANTARICIINGLFTLSISGNLTQNQQSATTSGTTSILLNGTGTWSNASTGALQNNLTINTAGTLTIGTNVYYQAGTLTYTTGTVDTTGSTLNIGTSTTLDTNVINWNNIIIGTGTQTLTSDLNCQDLTSGGGSSNIINGLFNVNVKGNLTANGVILGTSTIVLIGTSLWTATNNSNTFRIPIIINTNGIITLSNALYVDGNLTYTKGIVISKNTLITFGLTAKTLINLHKINFKNIIINESGTITMNEFFNGSPGIVTTINSLGGTNYTITFQDGFEKISKFVNINNCTLSKPQQLLVITNSPRSSTNTRGIRYINQSPNGIAKGDATILNTMTASAGGYVKDPNMK